MFPVNLDKLVITDKSSDNIPSGLVSSDKSPQGLKTPRILGTKYTIGTAAAAAKLFSFDLVKTPVNERARSISISSDWTKYGLFSTPTSANTNIIARHITKEVKKA